jgi:lysophospholipase L1-like esterase
MAGCVKQDIKNIGSRGKAIICFGDSITFGYGADPGEDYPTALSKMTSIPVINKGIDGDTSQEAFKRIVSDVLVHDPLLVIVEFGGNDFLHKVPVGETKVNIGKIIDKIQAGGAMVALADISAGIVLSEYRGIISTLAKEKGAIFIPSILNGIITNPNLKSDFIHPNRNGYRIIAHRVYRAILPYLNQNSLSRRLVK